jgi:alkylation response protein AidB-like acyl-CoA dehydrogenase
MQHYRRDANTAARHPGLNAVVNRCSASMQGPARRTTEEVVLPLTDAGFFCIFTPVRFGGYVADIRTANCAVHAQSWENTSLCVGWAVRDVVAHLAGHGDAVARRFRPGVRARTV